MNKYKYLFKNIGLISISSFGSKLLSIFLIPLYTRILTTAEYGIYDLFYTTISLLIPILTVNIVESVLRFSLDSSKRPKEIFSYGLSVISKSLIPLSLGIIINYWFGIIPVINDYLVCFILFYLSLVMTQLLQAFARGINKLVDISICGILSSLVILTFNILFLLYFKWGIRGYFLANILGQVFGTLFLCLRIKIFQYISFDKFSTDIRLQMIKYSRPLVLDSISWWINNASDRYIVIWLCGIAANGIYSVGYKIPSILNIFNSIFNQAWILSSVKDFDPDDKRGFFSNIYSCYNFFMVVVCSVLIMSTRILAKFLYAKEFYIAWCYVPLLLIAVVFGSMSGFIGGIFAAVRDSRVFAKTTVIGAISNIIMNVAFVKLWGPIGAALATACAFYIVWLARVIYMKKYISLKINLLRDHVVYLILIIQTIMVLVLDDNILMYCFQFIMLCIILALNREIVKRNFSMIKRKIILQHN